MLSDSMTINMNAINADLFPKQVYQWLFESGDISDGVMEFPKGISVILKGESAIVALKLSKEVKASVGDTVKERKELKGSGQIITIN